MKSHFRTSRYAARNVQAPCILISTAMRAGLLLTLLLTSACNTTPVKNQNTLSLLDQTNISVNDEKVDDSLHKAMESYRKYIEQASASNIRPEAIHRLADLEVDKSYQIEGVEAPAEPGARTAINHYTRLLAVYPMYDHNDRVLYQLSRAYEEAGENKNAVETLEKLASRYTDFEHMDEVKFRLGEHYFRDKRYPQANNAYAAVLAYGKDNVFYKSALMKQGWSYFKQDRYSQALSYFIATLDHEVEQGYVPGNSNSREDNKQIDDTYRAISLSFSYMGGASAIEDYIKKDRNTPYKEGFYRSLADYYISKDRYTDAANTYQAYIDRQPFSETSPYYAMLIIETYQLGGFFDLATAARKNFSIKYGPDAGYWKKLNSGDQPQTVEYHKSNIRALASNYHARYKKLQNSTDKHDSYTRAIHWYREYYYLYPLDENAPLMSKLLAELYLENGDYQSAAREFERIAKNDPTAEIAADSAYAAIFAYRENLKLLPEPRRPSAREQIAEKSLWFAEKYPQHAETAAVLTAAAYDYLLLKNYTSAIANAKRVISGFSDTDKSQLLSAHIVLADAAFELGQYAEAEKSYSRILAMTDASDNKRAALIDNLAASIYKQAEHARENGDHGMAAQYFLRLKAVAPSAGLSASAQYEAASELVTIGDWSRAAVVLEDFQQQNPAHELSEVTTRNLAAIYRKNDEKLKAAAKLERVANNNVVIRRGALLQAAELYQQAKSQDDALRVYKQYANLFPSPAEAAIETYKLIADIYKSKNDIHNYQKYLSIIIAADAKAGKERTEQTRYLAAQSQLVLAEISVKQFMTVELTKPFKAKLELKKKKMSAAIEQLTRLLEYQVSETTTAATYYIAETYLHFSQALANSERPTGLNELELEQYELALEEQAYLFEEKAISVYEKNTELLDDGIHDPWVEKSITRLSALFPAQYAKPEQQSGYLKSLFAVDDRT